MLRQAGSKPAPITSQLRILPEVPDNSPGQSKHRPIVEERQKNGRKISYRCLVGCYGTPVLRNLQRLTASINVTKASKILGGNRRSGPEQKNGQNARRQ